MEDPSKARSALGAGRARSQAIITRRKRGDFLALDSDQHVFPHNCTLEAMRTQGRFSLFLSVTRDMNAPSQNRFRLAKRQAIVIILR